MRKIVLSAACLAFTALGASVQAQEQTHYGFGSSASPDELAKFVSVSPDGRGLPAGSGDAAKGKQVFASTCAACHGEHLEGNPAKGIGGDKLIGGRGSLATKAPIKTVESYWPYSTTLFDYVKRAMPFNAPGSLSDDDVYNVVAYILSEAKVIASGQEINASTLPKVVMPNRNGFEPDPRPEIELYR
jgi:cytochrome c